VPEADIVQVTPILRCKRRRYTMTRVLESESALGHMGIYEYNLVTVQGIPTVSGRYSNDLSGHMSTTLLKDIE